MSDQDTKPYDVLKEEWPGPTKEQARKRRIAQREAARTTKHDGLAQGIVIGVVLVGIIGSIALTGTLVWSVVTITQWVVNQ